MKYTFLRYIFIFYLLGSCWDQLEAQSGDIWFVGDLQVVPYSYDLLLPLSSFKVDFSGLLGIKNGQYNTGVEIVCTQFFTESQTGGFPLEGSRFNMALLWDSFYNLTDFLQVKWGWGGFWLRDSFTYTGGVPEINNLGGFTLVADFKLLFPWKYLSLQILNKVELIYDFDTDYTVLIMDPGYRGGLRLNIKPGLDWLDVYLQASGVFWSYSSVENQVDTMMLQFATGITVDTSRMSRRKTEPEDPKERIRRELGKTFPELLALGEAEQGDELSIPGIYFQTDTALITADSQRVLDALAEWLSVDPGLYLELSAYAQINDNPKSDYALYMARTLALQVYLGSRGIAAERVVPSAYGIIVVRGQNAEGNINLKIITKITENEGS